MSIDRNRGYVALVLGFGLSLLPEVLSHIITSSANWADVLFQWMGIIDFPGALVAIPLAGGNIHGVNLLVIVPVSGLFYTVVFYWVQSFVARFRQTANQPGNSAN